MPRRSILIVILLAGPRPAHAAEGGDLDLNAFRHAIDSRGFITTNASQVLGAGELSFGLVTSWGHGVLSLQDGATTYAVANVFTPTLQAAVGFRVGLGLELGLSVPFQVVSGDVNPDSDGGTPADPNDDQRFGMGAQGVGDVGGHVKLRVLDTSYYPVGVALLASVYVPGGYERGQWLGEGRVTVVPWLIVDTELGAVRLGANLGLRMRGGGGDAHMFLDDGTRPAPLDPAPATLHMVSAGTDLPFSLAASYAVVPRAFELCAEVFGAAPLAGGTRWFPLEAVAGVKLYLARSSFFLLGGGIGLMPGEAGGGGADVRAFIGMIFEPSVGDRDEDGKKDDVDECPDDPEDFDDFEDADGCPEPDNDRDTILDVDDGCPNEPEDRDQIDDDDGCPEGEHLDRDGDTLWDDEDACPDEPEDLDGFEDEDGCPDYDNDHDRLLDVDDLCPNDPEDHDGWQDTDGCPDLDNDKDRILDIDDRCPLEPETPNNFDDEDGCPDRTGATRTETGIITLDNVYFETNLAKIKPVSYPILDAVAATMLANPDITLLEVQGHTDERNTREYNLELSQRRAEAVRSYLIDEGVEPERLRAQGYGEDEPIDTAHTKAAWAKNRRVEFIIVR